MALSNVSPRPCRFGLRPDVSFAFQFQPSSTNPSWACSRQTGTLVWLAYTAPPLAAMLPKSAALISSKSTAVSVRGAASRSLQAKALADGYDPQRFAAHSLRPGFLTAAVRSGASVFKMREVSRHKSMQALADYVRNAELFRDHAGGGFP